MRKKIPSLILTLALLASFGTAALAAGGNGGAYVLTSGKDIKADNGNALGTDSTVDFTVAGEQPEKPAGETAAKPVELRNPFSDVSEEDEAYEAVIYAYENGLMNGVGSGKFAPESIMNRAIIMTTLWRMAGEPEVGGDPVFTDVPEDAWYTTAVRWAMSKEIVKGMGNKIFAPMSSVTREQAAVMMFRHAAAGGMVAVTLEENLNGFPDGDQLAEYAVSAMNWAVGQGIITARAGGTLDPKGTVNRGELAGMMMRLDQFLKQVKEAATESVEAE